MARVALQRHGGGRILVILLYTSLEHFVMPSLKLQ